MNIITHRIYTVIAYNCTKEDTAVFHPMAFSSDNARVKIEKIMANGYKVVAVFKGFSKREDD